VKFNAAAMQPMPRKFAESNEGEKEREEECGSENNTVFVSKSMRRNFVCNL
jgi:hypothetical protein